MSLGSIAIWIVQGIVTWLIYMDLRPSGGRLVGRALGLDSSRSIWAWLIGSAWRASLVLWWYLQQFHPAPSY